MQIDATIMENTRRLLKTLTMQQSDVELQVLLSAVGSFNLLALRFALLTVNHVSTEASDIELAPGLRTLPGHPTTKSSSNILPRWKFV